MDPQFVYFSSSRRAVTDQLVAESFMFEQRFLRFRSLTMRAIAAAVYLSEEDVYQARSHSR